MLRFLVFIGMCAMLLFNGKQALASNIISVAELSDSALNKCVDDHVSNNNWKTIDEVIKLKCHGMNIKSVEGLEVFTQLKSLSLYNNKLITLNISRLKNLKSINVANNKLQQVNVVGLSKLTSLYLFKNKLTHIDFTGLTQLEKIRITNNQLNKIDISPLISLKKAYFFDNKLEELIVKGLPNLKFIELRQNPMPDDVYDRYDALDGITIVHDGNADDWK